LVFMLWGNDAQQKMSLIDPQKHCLLVAAHPSPFSAARGFFGCRHFSKANNYLINNNKEPINWHL
jgi:uracil-DNA glycosylase